MDAVTPPRGNGPFNPRINWEINLGHILQVVVMALIGGLMTFFLSLRSDVQTLTKIAGEHEVRLTALERTIDAQDKRFQAYTDSMHREFTAYQEANRSDISAVKDLIANIRVLIAEQARPHR